VACRQQTGDGSDGLNTQSSGGIAVVAGFGKGGATEKGEEKAGREAVTGSRAIHG